MRFYIEPHKVERQPDGVAMQAFVKTSGDTVGVIFIRDDGGWVLWREGSCIGTFASPTEMYRKLEAMDV